MTHDPVEADVDVSVVVVAYECAAVLSSCLSSISPAAGSRSVEAIVIDNASTDDVNEAVADAELPVRVLRMPINRGFAAGANAGAQVARGRHLVFLNPDAAAAPGSILSLVDAAERRPGHLLYSGRVVRPDGSLDPGCVMPLPSLREHAAFASGISTIIRSCTGRPPGPLGAWQRDDERVVPAVSGAFLLSPRHDFLAVGGFDERYFMYSEDVDLSVRAHRAGRPPLFVPGAQAVHQGGTSSSTSEKATMVLRGKVTYVHQHWGPVRRRVSLGMLSLGVALRALGSVSGRGAKWRDVWRRRAQWRAGW